MSNEPGQSEIFSPKPPQPIQGELPLGNMSEAIRVIELGKPADTAELLTDIDVLFYGETHTDYAIADYLLSQVAAFKTAGVTSFGFEINPDPINQEIFDEINSGKLDRLPEIDWSLGFGNPTVRQTKQRMVEELVKAGIKVYPFANWSAQENIQTEPYTEESEKKAAEIIGIQTEKGKTVVLVGSRHADYTEKLKFKQFPHTADCVKALRKNSKSLTFAGGMPNPGDYDRSPEAKLRAGANEKVQVPTFIDTSEIQVQGYFGDGIIVLPVVPFLSARAEIPEERRSIGGFTPLTSVEPTTALQEVRAEITSGN